MHVPRLKRQKRVTWELLISSGLQNFNIQLLMIQPISVEWKLEYQHDQN